MKFHQTYSHRQNVKSVTGNKSFDYCSGRSLDSFFVSMHLLFCGVCVAHLLYFTVLGQVTLWSHPPWFLQLVQTALNQQTWSLKLLLWDLVKNALLKSCLFHLWEQTKMYLEHTAIQIVLWIGCFFVCVYTQAYAKTVIKWTCWRRFWSL